MLILEKPFVSDALIEWAVQAQHPVLRNAVSEEIVANGSALNLVDSVEAAARVNAGERLLTNSENAIGWVRENVDIPSMQRALDIYKDKALMRKTLASMNPYLFFETHTLEELEEIDPAKLPYPFVLKPNVGFCSVGVFAIENESDWKDALEALRANLDDWNARYPDNVLEMGDYILEGYIDGTEYAIDAYYDEEGNAHVLNVLRHDFAGPDDTSDRMYVTSAVIIDKWVPRFKKWLDDVNELVDVRAFPVHVEVRVQDDGQIVPIEFNPLRFAGLGGTDVAYYGFGMRTYEQYLKNKEPDMDKLLDGKQDLMWSMSVLNAPEGAADSSRFDYDALAARFRKTLELSRFDAAKTGNFGMMFLETTPEEADDLDYLMRTDLREYIN